MATGSTDQFHTNWISREETNYLHWTRSNPINQIQFAFRQNWITFCQILKEYGISKPGRALEVGCGRGSMSAYFADDEWNVTLLDYSEKAIATAKQLFLAHNLSAEFTVADCLDMPFPDASYDVIFSIGLFEHFQDVSSLIAEQARLLKPNGVLIGYVVPDYSSNSNNIQARFNAVNKILEHLHRNRPDEPANTKSEIFRSDYSSQIYLDAMTKNSLTKLTSFGVYPLPMISHSTAFPFSLMDSYSESILVNDFDTQLSTINSKYPWRCDEGFGQAFIVAGQKK